MKQKILITLCISLYSLSSFAQDGISRALKEIEKNNKSLIAEKQYWEAEKLSYKTGLAPDNPKAEIDYMVGSPEGAGNQRDIAVTQGFDFPTSYIKRKNVAEQRIINADHKYNAIRQQVLLEAKLLCIAYVFRSKMGRQLEKRLNNADKLLTATNEKTGLGEASILDLNKVRLLQLEIKTQVELNATERETIQHQLDQLNGGLPLNTSDLTYLLLADVPSFEVIDSLIEANDPVVKAVRQEKEIKEQQLALTRSLTLPKLEAGYHQQAILGQKYEGIHIGMTIPLWESKNKVKTQKARIIYSDLAIEEHRNEHYFENKRLYEKYQYWENAFRSYQEILENTDNEDLLHKALAHGQINLIQYLMEKRYFHEAVNSSLEAEKELQSSIARLLKFQL